MGFFILPIITSILIYLLLFKSKEKITAAFYVILSLVPNVYYAITLTDHSGPVFRVYLSMISLFLSILFVIIYLLSTSKPNKFSVIITDVLLLTVGLVLLFSDGVT